MKKAQPWKGRDCIQLFFTCDARDMLLRSDRCGEERNVRDGDDALDALLYRLGSRM